MNDPGTNPPKTGPTNPNEAEEWKQYRADLIIFERMLSRFDGIGQTLVKTGGLIIAAMLLGGVRVGDEVWLQAVYS